MSLINKTIGLKVKYLKKIHDYFQVVFSENTTLNIYNNFHFTGKNLNNIVGNTVSSIDESSKSITITFNKSQSLVISLETKDWNTSEALALYLPDGSIIVWN